MTGSVALDVVIGLVFVFTLYSLFATTVVEIIASAIRLRATYLVKGIRRMLDDDSGGHNWSSAFFKQTLIKYLGRGRIVKKPSYLSAQNFSKALIDMLKGNSGEPNPERIRATLKEAPDLKDAPSETKAFVLSLLDDANNDLDKFKLLLEKWYDDTMERVSSWYKKRVQVITLVIGFFIAMIFNVDTILIVQILSKDQHARDQMVQLAIAYHAGQRPAEDHNPAPIAASAQLDSLMTSALHQIEGDINQANSVLGLGWDLPDSLDIIREGDINFLR